MPHSSRIPDTRTTPMPRVHPSRIAAPGQQTTTSPRAAPPPLAPPEASSFTPAQPETGPTPPPLPPRPKRTPAEGFRAAMHEHPPHPQRPMPRATQPAAATHGVSLGTFGDFKRELRKAANNDVWSGVAQAAHRRTTPAPSAPSSYAYEHAAAQHAAAPHATAHAYAPQPTASASSSSEPVPEGSGHTTGGAAPASHAAGDDGSHARVSPDPDFVYAEPPRWEDLPASAHNYDYVNHRPMHDTAGGVYASRQDAIHEDRRRSHYADPQGDHLHSFNRETQLHDDLMASQRTADFQRASEMQSTMRYDNMMADMRHDTYIQDMYRNY